jgi:surface antigen
VTLYNSPYDYDAGYPTSECQADKGRLAPDYPDLVIPCVDSQSLDQVAAAQIKGHAFLDPWGYFLRNCTSFVAWQLYEHGVPPKAFMGLGDGGQWATAAAARRETVGVKPKPGAVAVSVSHDHVAYVLAVNSGAVTFAEYNRDQGGRYAGLGDEQTVTEQAMASLGFAKYIYFAPLMTKGHPGQLEL